jgi:hypothetical protein
MGEPARDDEDAEAHHQPVEGQVAAPARDVQQCKRNREVRHRDQDVGDDVHPQHAWAPHLTVSMRQELPAREPGHIEFGHAGSLYVTASFESPRGGDDTELGNGDIPHFPGGEARTDLALQLYRLDG